MTIKKNVNGTEVMKRKKNRSDIFTTAFEMTIEFESEEDYNRFLNMLGIGMIEYVEANNLNSYEERKKYFETYTSIIEQLPVKGREKNVQYK